MLSLNEKIKRIADTDEWKTIVSYTYTAHKNGEQISIAASSLSYDLITAIKKAVDKSPAYTYQILPAVEQGAVQILIFRNEKS